jgi:hypothetical protein
MLATSCLPDLRNTYLRCGYWQPPPAQLFSSTAQAELHGGNIAPTRPHRYPQFQPAVLEKAAQLAESAGSCLALLGPADMLAAEKCFLKPRRLGAA